MPAERLRLTRLFSLTACALALIGTAAGQDGEAPADASRDPWTPAALQELPLPDAITVAQEISAPPEHVPAAGVGDAHEPSSPDTASADRDDDVDVPSPPPSLVDDLPDDLPQAPFDDAVDEADAFVDANASERNAPLGVGNDDVLAMTRAQFSEPTILAVIEANSTRFDVSPRALVALKTEGVSENVINAMLDAEQARKQPPPATETEAPPPSEEFTKLSAMIERLAAQQEAAEAARKPPELPKSTDSSPRAWTLLATEKTAVAPTIAQVAFSDEKGGNRLKTLQSLAGKALAFTNPAVSGIATTLGGLFRSDDEERTAVWALAGTTSSRELAPQTAFEIGFGHTPGVDPDAYQPAIVRLVRTNDNYRLVAAAKTEGTKTIATTKDPIVEELVPTDLTRIARGHYRVQPKERLGTGEYALVLRPIVQKERRRRGSDPSLGELLGGGTSQILYLTWDFSVAASD